MLDSTSIKILHEDFLFIFNLSYYSFVVTNISNQFSKNRKGSIFGKGLSLSFRLSTPKSKTERNHGKIIEQNGSKMSLDGNDPPSEASSNASSSIAMGPTSHDFDSFGESGEMPARFERRSSISNLRSSWPPIGSQHGANILGFSAAAYEAARYDFTHPNNNDRNVE